MPTQAFVKHLSFIFSVTIIGFMMQTYSPSKCRLCIEIYKRNKYLLHQYSIASHTNLPSSKQNQNNLYAKGNVYMPVKNTRQTMNQTLPTKFQSRRYMTQQFTTTMRMGLQEMISCLTEQASCSPMWSLNQNCLFKRTKKYTRDNLSILSVT